MQSTARSGLTQDLALAGVCTVALVVLLAYVFNPVQAGDTPARDDIAPLGILSVRERDVRHRADGTLVWKETRRGEAVHDGDGIYVGEGGSAVVQLNSGAHLEIEDRSMVVLHPTPTGYDPDAAIDLRWGSASGVALGGPLAIRMQGAQVQVEEGGRASVRLQADNSVAITVPKGSASLRLAQGKPVTMGALEKRIVNLHQGSVGPAEHLATSLGAPGAAERIFVHGDGQAIEFSWQPVPQATSYTWELSGDGSFGHVLAAQQTREATVRYANLAAGNYHWRVRVTVGKQTSSSEERIFSVVDDRAPTPLLPRADAALDVSKHTDISLGWSAIAGVQHYQVELSDTKGGGVQTWRSPYAGLNVSTVHLDEGGYCYRVRADEAERGGSPWSKPHCFRIISHPVLKAPKLLEPAPAPHKQGFLWHLVGGVANAAEGAPAAVVLRWEALEGAAAYKLEVATDNAMEQVVARMRVGEPFFRWEPPQARVYYWRVRGVDADGREGDPSVVEVLDVRPPTAAPLAVSSPPQPAAAAPQAASIAQKNPPPTIIAPRLKPRQSSQPSKAPAASTSHAAVDSTPAPTVPPPLSPPPPQGTGRGDALDSALTPPFSPSGWVGARVAAFANFGDVTTVQPGIEFGVWVANRWDTQFGVRLGVDYHTSAVDAVSADGLVHASSRLQRLPVTLSAMGLWPFRIVDVTAAAGLRAAWTYVAQGVTGQPSRSEGAVEWGGLFSAGVQRAVGPGALFAELSYDVTSAQTTLVHDAPDGLALALGYRLRVF